MTSADTAGSHGQREVSGRGPRRVAAHLDVPVAATSIGVVAPFDFVIDRELWQLVPDDITLHLTRTPRVNLPVTVALAEAIAEEEAVAAASRNLSIASPVVTVYLCTSGSFVAGIEGEARLRAVMEQHGMAPAVTASGALLQALEALDVRRVGVGTPYTLDLTIRLGAFLVEAGYEPVRTAYLGLTANISRVSRDTVRALARAACSDEAEAVFLSCTNLPTVDVLADLEDELGRPVLSANLVSMWSALRSLRAASGLSAPRRP